MTDREFCYWLQGFFELTDETNLSKEQVAMIKEHLALVFNKVTTISLNSPLTLSDIRWNNTDGVWTTPNNAPQINYPIADPVGTPNPLGFLSFMHNASC